MTAVAVASAVAALSLAILLARQRRHTSRLEQRLEAAARQLEQLQHSFSRFAPAEVIERVIQSGVSTSGEKKEVTALFADLVGFTGLSERLEPTELVRILNGYFERMSRAITDHRGYVSTFLGDGILALFGALEPNPWQADDAVRAALAMREELARYGEELAREGHAPLAIGIGIERGIGVAGLVGSEDLMEFTVVGRTVNVAARVQDLTRQHDADLIVTETVRQGLDPRFRLRPLPPTQVKGVSEPLEIHAVEGLRG